MERNCPVNWKKIFLAGLILSLSPFNIFIRTGFFTVNFYYSVLGTGMLILSFFYKKRQTRDYFIITLLLLAIITSLSSLPQSSNIFLFLFFLFFTNFYLVESRVKALRIGSYMVTAFIGFYFASSFETYYGLIYFPQTQALVYAPFFFIIAIFILMCFSYKELYS